MPASRSFFRWWEKAWTERFSNSGTSSQTQTLPACLRQHVHELQPDRVAEGLGHLGHPQRLLALNIRIDDGLTARRTIGALLLGRQLQIDRHQSTYINNNSRLSM